MTEKELIDGVGKTIPVGTYSEKEISLAFIMFRNGYEYAIEKMKPNKIYAITHRGYEFDDIGYPDLAPIKFFSTKEKRDDAFKEIVTKELEWFENGKNSKYSNPDNYEIGENTNDDFLELYMDKWCYEWGKTEFEIED